VKFLEVRVPEAPYLEILPISDLHLGSSRHLRGALDRLLRWLRADPYRRFILNGDLIDNATRQSVGDPFSATMSPQQQKNVIEDALKPFAERILLVTTGNHEARTYKATGSDPSEDIARYLGVPYCPSGAFVKVAVGKRKKTEENHNQRPVLYTLYVLHGACTGKSAGAPLDFAQDLEHTVDADCYLVGHAHRPVVSAKSFFRLDIRTGRVRCVRHVFVMSGSAVAWGGSEQSKGLPPSVPVLPYVRLSGEKYDLEPRMLALD
jgi:predicted phosphodiesterase